ncbi:MAG: hypothetical protein H7A33_06800 [Deltaproteobacteria bacterium]|nr:hypothetical protein [Deltaproteobacteria bacterium]
MVKILGSPYASRFILDNQGWLFKNGLTEEQLDYLCQQLKKDDAFRFRDLHERYLSRTRENELQKNILVLQEQIAALQAQQ